jgi:hypothetical protein
MHAAKRKMRFDASPEQAKKLYDEGFAKWRAVIDEFPDILDDDAMTGEDLLEFIKEYRDVLDQMEEKIPDDFPLWDVIENFDREQDFVEEIAEHKRRKSGESAPTSTEPEPATTPEPAAETPEPAAATPATPEPTPPSTDPAPATSESAPASETPPPEPPATQSQQ